MAIGDFLGSALGISSPEGATIDPFRTKRQLKGQAETGAAAARDAVGGFGLQLDTEQGIAQQAGEQMGEDVSARRQAQQGLGQIAGQTAQQSDQLGQQQQQIRQQAQQQFGQGRDVQAGAVDMARQAAMGEGPSAAQAQMQAGQDAAAAQQFALARSGGAQGEAARMRQAQRTAGQQSTQAANAAAQLAAQEQQAGQQLFGSLAGQARAQDTAQAQALGSLAGQQRQGALQTGQLAGSLVGQAGGLAQQGAGLQGGLMDAAQQRQLAALQGQGQLGLGLGDQAFQQFMGPEQVNAQAAQAQAQRGQQFVGGLFSAGGSLGSAALMSDEREKVDIDDGSEGVRGFLDTLEPHTYAYRDPSAEGAAPGRRFGIMAQDLERSTAGRSVVRDGPDGRKRVDVPQATGLALAGLGDLHRRLAKLEGRDA